MILYYYHVSVLICAQLMHQYICNSSMYNSNPSLNLMYLMFNLFVIQIHVECVY